MTTVLAITSGMQQAAARLRMGELVSPLRERGIELQIAAWGKNLVERRALIRSAAQFDAVILQRRLLDPGNARALRRHAKKIYFDVDDAVMFHAGQVGWWSRWRTDRRFAATCRVVDHVVAGNEYLADIFRDKGCVASVQPTVVDPLHYRVKVHGQPAAQPSAPAIAARESTDAVEVMIAESTATSERAESPAATSRADTTAGLTPPAEVRLVWIGSHSTIGYLDSIRPALAAAIKIVPGLRLTIIADQTMVDAPVPVDFVPWTEAGEAEALAAADIGIAPTPEDRWTLGKCGFKIVQYMAAGLPVIASPVGANAAIVRDGETGFLATTPDEWTTRIIELCGDITTRAKFGAMGRRDVWSIYNTARAADFWARLLSSIKKE